MISFRMKQNDTPQAMSARTRNIVISGTNFWNPGDDFVRDGVIRVLREVFAGETLNFQFYNFNPEFLPQDKFAGAANYLSKGDLEKCRDFVDAVVIAGLSAGDEIKDLYRWIVANGLEDKVWLIGAGYENSYVAQHVAHEPEATIFRKARIILGRTEKKPEFIKTLGTPYFHVNCPAILSVPEVKTIAPGQAVQRIGFSIQLPHGVGLVNHGCAREQYELGVAILRELARNYSVEVVAHHKTEYFHFLNLLRNENIPVIFSAFYQDLHQIYPRYDLLITTRLHSSLFANGHGIPGIILNDTDRHTHALEGFLHSEWVNDLAGFQRAFQKICRRDLADIAREARVFKSELLARYVSLLSPVAGVKTAAASYAFDSEKKEQALVRSLVAPGMVAFDVGANIGKYTKLFSLLVGGSGKVFAFEPDPRSAERVRKLVAESALDNVTIINQAVAESPGKVTLNQFPDEYCSWNSLGRPHMEDPRNPSQFVPIVSSVEVEAVTLDDFCRAHGIDRIDYLKLDVEGAEFRALQGARDLLSRQAIRFLQFEVSLKMLEGLDTCAKPVFDLLASLGYECHAISNEGEMLGIVFDSAEFYENYIAVPAQAGVLNEEFFSKLLGELQHPANKQHVLNIITKLKPDYWLEKNFTRYQDTGAWFDTATLLNWIARALKPKNYLEIGVRRGRSMAQVLVESPGTEAFGFDLWIPDYGSNPAEGIHTTNPGPEFVLGELAGLGVSRLPKLVRGDSHETVPAFFKNPDHPQKFDLVLVDGDHSTTGARADLELAFAHLAPGGMLIFDDICNSAHPELRAVWDEFSRRHPDYLFINDHTGAGTGVAFCPPFNRLQAAVEITAPVAAEPYQALPVHFFTIVLNGLPFLRHHINEFKQLPFRWHWHIVEGVAELNHDTAWSKAAGGKIPHELHRGGLSMEGTTEYLDALKKEFPKNITIHRPPAGKFWDGKREMVNAPLANITAACLLWQVDADELWTAEQIIRTRDLFLAHPEKTAALFYCHYFVGPELVVTSRGTYGNYENEWLRVWRYLPGDRWATHEPPRLCRGTLEVASINPFRHAETEPMGLVFQHYAYATAAQLLFKEFYYGYAGAVAQWRKLQQANTYPVKLSDFFGWVKDAAVVNTTAATGLNRLAPDEWFGNTAAKTPGPLDHVGRILFVRTDSIGDAVLASAMLEPIRRRWPNAKVAVLCQHQVANLFFACPFVDSIICYEAKKMNEPGERQQIVDEIAAFRPDLILNSVRSRDRLSDDLTLAYAEAQHAAIESDLDNLSPADQEAARARYELLIPSPAGHRSELERHADFLRGLGIDTPPLKPAVWTSPEDEALAGSFFQSNQLDPARTLVLFPFTQHGIKDYPAFAAALKNFTGWDILMLGGPETSGRGEELAALLPGRVWNLIGRTTLGEMAAMIRRCRILVGSDSCATHMACAVGVPNVVVLGGGHFGRFLPYSPLTTVATVPLDCFGCNWRCRYDTPHCITSLAPAVLDAAIVHALKGPRQKPAIFAPETGREKSGPGMPAVLAANVAPGNVDYFAVATSEPVSGFWPSLQYGTGVHKDEGSFRWLDLEAELQVEVPIGAQAATLSFELQAAEMAGYPRRCLRVEVSVNGRSHDSLILQTDRQVAPIRLSLAPAAEPYSVRIHADQFIPGDNAGRRLTVQLRKVRLIEVQSATIPPATPPLVLQSVPAADWNRTGSEELKFAPCDVAPV